MIRRRIDVEISKFFFSGKTRRKSVETSTVTEELLIFHQFEIFVFSVVVLKREMGNFWRKSDSFCIKNENSFSRDLKHRFMGYESSSLPLSYLTC